MSLIPEEKKNLEVISCERFLFNKSKDLVEL